MSFDLGILVLRILFGAAMAAHGAQKLFGSFGGYGLKGTGGFFETLGFRPGIVFAAMAGFGEFGGGLLFAAGLFTPIGVALILSTMLVAIFAVHIKNGFFVMTSGIEVPFLYGVAAIVLAFTGPGTFSLDHLFRLDNLFSPAVTISLLGLSVLAAIITLAMRQQPKQQEQKIAA